MGFRYGEKRIGRKDFILDVELKNLLSLLSSIAKLKTIQKGVNEYG